MELFPHDTTTAINQKKAGECEAIEVILSAMKTHMNNVDVCENGCLALCIITANNGKHQPQSKDNLNEIISTNPTTAGNQAEAGRCGAIEVILNAMDAHMNITGVCEYGCMALCIITVNGKQQPQSKGNFE